MKIELKLRNVKELNANEQAMLAVELEQALKNIIANDPSELQTLTEFCRRTGNEDEKINIEVII